MKKLLLVGLALLFSNSFFAQTGGQKPSNGGQPKTENQSGDRPSGGGGWQGGGRGGAGFDPKTMPAIGKIWGSVVDSMTNEPIAFATVTLAHLMDSTYFTGGVTDEKGRFSISEMRVGPYKMTIDFIGYQKLERRVRLNQRNGVEQDLGKIHLFSKQNDLKTVEIVADKPLMTNGIDRKIFNVEKLATVAGGSATDALRNVPLVQVDIDGNISMRGSDNLTVLIDGRPSGLTGAGRKALLENLPASSIESIEVITNPSAKYDPDGTSGIINIVLKKNRLQGMSGSASVGVGSREKYNTSAQLNFRRGRLNTFANYSFRLENNRSDGTGFTHYFDSLGRVRSSLSQLSVGKSEPNNQFLKLGGDYQIFPKTTFGASATLNFNRRKEDETVATTDSSQLFLQGLRLRSVGTRQTKTASENTNFDYNFNLKRDFKGRGHNLLLDFSSSKNEATNDRDFENRNSFLYGSTGPFDPYFQQTKTATVFRLTTAQADYTRPFGEIGKLEAGVKMSERKVDTDFKALNFDTTTDAFQLDLRRTNHFIFDEKIVAGYLNLNRKWGKFGAQAGLRAEQANTTSELVTTDSTYENNYASLFPSLFLTYELAPQRTFGFNYSRRINRPQTDDLNPFAELTDTLNIRRGNPYLKPEYIHSFELSYQFLAGSFNIVPMIYYRITTDQISRYSEKISPLSNVFINTQVNLNQQQAWGFDLVANGSIKKWWSVLASVNGSYSSLDASNLPVVTNANSWRMWSRGTSTWQLKRDFEIQLSGMFSPKSKVLLGNHLAMYSLDAAFTKKFWKKNASLSLRLSDIFDTRRFGMELETADYTRDSRRKRESRIAFLTFSYKFGKLSEQKQRGQGRRRDDGGNGPSGGDDF